MSAKPFHWADIQQNTFTRWVNEHLKDRGMHVKDLAKDFSNGLAIINLMEIISGKSIGRYNKHPAVEIQKTENCQIAINFIQAEGIKLVNISGGDLYENRLKLILGLIFTLIVRYEIQKKSQDSSLSAEEELLRWVQSKIPEYGIKNFTTDWNNGKALCGLIHALRPNLCGNHGSLSASNALANATEGINTGESRMGVAPLIAPEEIIHPRVDKSSVMTYIAQYRNVGEFDESHLCSAYGEGLVDGVIQQEGTFHIHTPPEGKGIIKVSIKTPSGKEEPVEMKQSGHEYECKYIPTEIGIYHISITYDSHHIPGSIFNVIIREYQSLGGEGKIRVFISTTSSSEKGRQDVFNLQKLLTEKKIHEKPDFEPFAPVDLMDRHDREAVFQRAGTRNLPIIFIDDQYFGDYDTLVAADRAGKLDSVLKTGKSLYERDQERLAKQ